MSDTARRVYSARRFRLVVLLLTLVFVPIVVGASLLIYQYMRFGVLVEQRLTGEKGRLPSRVYARPLVLRPGLVLAPDGLVKVLNGLRYTAARRGADRVGPVLRLPGGRDALSPAGRLRGDGAAPRLLRHRQAGRDPRQGHPRRGRAKKRYLEQALEAELVTYLFDEDREKRRRVRFEELPDHLVKAVLAIEDRRFFSHPGLDPIALVAAAIRNLRSDSSIPHGASTLTQQLCKNFFLTSVDERGLRTAERSYRRKAQEALLAFVLERRATKQEILELYLNGVYLGQSGSFGINGVGEAARIYFRKDVANLTLPESALLAGMIQSPNPYNPFRHEKRATERRNEVVRAMQDAGFIDTATMEEALRAPLLVERAQRRDHGRPLLRRPRAPAARPALRGEGPHDPEPLDLHDARPAPAGPRPAGAGAGPRAGPGAHQEAHDRAGPGQPDRHRAGQRQGRGARGRALVRPQPVQPRHAGPAPAGQHVQALRVPGRLRGHLRRPEPAPDHARDGGRGRAGGVLLRGQGVHPHQLRGRRTTAW